MTVIYEFPVDSGNYPANYDIYFTNEELTDEQKSLIEWYRDVFRPEDLRLVESVQKGLEIAAIVVRGASWPTVAVVAFPNMVSPIWHLSLAVFKDHDIGGGIFRRH